MTARGRVMVWAQVADCIRPTGVDGRGLDAGIQVS